MPWAYDPCLHVALPCLLQLAWSCTRCISRLRCFCTSSSMNCARDSSVRFTRSTMCLPTTPPFLRASTIVLCFAQYGVSIVIRTSFRNLTKCTICYRCATRATFWFPSTFHWGGGIRPRTCLLYTSPSPRDRTRSRMPSSA